MAEGSVADPEAGSVVATSSAPSDSRAPSPAGEVAVGSAEHLGFTFARAAAAADRAVGLWLARSGPAVRISDDMPDPVPERSAGELHALRALVRASATAYARRLREQGTTPERMLVLVKTAAGHPGSPGFGVRELTNDVVRWSIEAYFEGV
jgi:hypothetical protein